MTGRKKNRAYLPTISAYRAEMTALLIGRVYINRLAPFGILRLNSAAIIINLGNLAPGEIRIE